MASTYLQIRLFVAFTYFNLIFISCISSHDIFRDKSSRSHYALDPKQTENLVFLEDKLYISLISVWESIEESSAEESFQCFIWVSTYLSEYEEDIKITYGVIGKQRAQKVVENPLLIFKMIRRIYSTLLDHIIHHCNEEKEPIVSQVVQENFKESGLKPPTEQDWHDALLGILRIQYVYGFDAVKQIRLGIFNNTQTKVTLWYDDCMALARKALKLNAEVIAYQWLSSASLCLKEKKFIDLQEYSELESELNSEWERLMKLVNIQTVYSLHNFFEDKKQKTMKSFRKYEAYKTCREEGNFYTSPKLYCFYQSDWNKYFLINPLKTEVLSVNPFVYQFYEFIGDKAIKHIERVSEDIWERSQISIANGGFEFDESRTSMTVGYDKDLDSAYDKTGIMLKLNRRIEMVTGLEVARPLASDLQVALYGSLGGFYDFHHDSLQQSNVNIAEEGDRLATFLMFASDVKMGGYTVFGRIGVFAKPIKGSAIFWYNLNTNGEPDNRMFHAGCPVVLGTKFGEKGHYFLLTNGSTSMKICGVGHV